MKRLIAIILLVTITLLNLTVVSAQESVEYLTRASAVEKIVRALYLSGSDTNFIFEEHYCMHPRSVGGYIHFVPDSNLLQKEYPVLCEIYSSVDGCGFSDISEENGNLSEFIILAEAMGIINGFGDNTFRPDKFITYNESIKMLVCAFCSMNFAGLNDVYRYPDDYIKIAGNTGITAGIDFDGNATVSSQDFNAMLSAALTNRYVKNLMGTFTPPVTAEECVKTYAEAAMDRNGALQFALYDDELKASTRNDFVSFQWITGMSSPWISEFEIAKTSDLEFEIVFYWETSTGPSGDSTIKLLLCQVDGSYKITKLYY